MTERTWGDVPNTDAKAEMHGNRKVVDVMAVYVENANIRLATVSGWFEVADVPNPFTYANGSLQVEVKCHWYGLKPEKEWLHLRITNKYRLVRRFDGDVVDNIQR
jgi:hypothetical protein